MKLLAWWRARRRAGGVPASVAMPRCAACDNVAVNLELTEGADGWHLRFQGFFGGNGEGDPIPTARAMAILEALTPPFTAAKIQAAGFYDDLGFCLPCAAFYCRAHWNVSTTGGGTCPAGHFKSLDPHWDPDEDNVGRPGGRVRNARGSE